MSLSSLSFTNITGTVSKTGVIILFVVCIDAVVSMILLQIFLFHSNIFRLRGRAGTAWPPAGPPWASPPPRPPPPRPPRPRCPWWTSPRCSSAAGPASAWCSYRPGKNKWKLNFCCNFYDNINVSVANLETGGEGVILQLVGETLTQRLAGAGVVRQAQVASHLRKYFF